MEGDPMVKVSLEKALETSLEEPLENEISKVSQ